MTGRRKSAVTGAFILMMITTGLWAGEPAKISIVGNWKIAVAAKNATGKTIRAELEVPPPNIVEVKAEKHDKLPDFDPNGWIGPAQGAVLTGVKAAECSTQGAIDLDSLVVAAGEGPGATGVPLNRLWLASLKTHWIHPCNYRQLKGLDG